MNNEINLEEKEIIFNGNNIMADNIKGIWTDLLESLKDPFIINIYKDKIAVKQVKISVLSCISENIDKVLKKSISAKVFIVNTSFNPNLSSKWISWIIDYVETSGALTTGSLESLIQAALAKSICLPDFIEIIENSDNDVSIIKSKIETYKKAQQVESVTVPDNLHINDVKEENIFNAFIDVLTATSDQSASLKAEGNNIKEELASLNSNFASCIDAFVTELDKKDSEINRLKLIIAAQKESINALRNNNKELAYKKEKLQEKVINYEKREMKRMSLAHKITEVSGLMNEINQNDIITI